MNNFDYYKNPIILDAINDELRHIKGSQDREDCNQEIFAELYDFMPLDDDEAKKIVKRVGHKFYYKIKQDYQKTAPYVDWKDWDDLGDGNYQRKSHIGSAD